MIVLKSADEILKMRRSGDISVEAMKRVLEAIRPGVTTKALDQIAFDSITGAGGIPSFKGYNGFPGSICTSVNEQVVHGIPGDRRLKEGDIISIDLGTVFHGYHSDMARTVGVGEIAKVHQNLIKVTKKCFYLGMAQAIRGNRISDIGRSIQVYAEEQGMGVVRELVGHGIGQQMHEPPDVPNFAGKSKGPVLRAGMTIAIEPMINLGTHKVRWSSDGWTVSAADGEYSAHYENTIAVTDGEPILLTVFEDDE